MYSLEVYVVQLNEEDEKHKHLCMADPTCLKKKTTVFVNPMFEIQARWFQVIVLVVVTGRGNRGDLRIHQHTSQKDKSDRITYNMIITRRDTKLSHCGETTPTPSMTLYNTMTTVTTNNSTHSTPSPNSTKMARNPSQRASIIFETPKTAAIVENKCKHHNS